MGEVIAEEEVPFQVSRDYTKEDIKRVQRTLLNIGKTAAQILEKNHIRHFIAYGTLLGAYRHKGFVPWDDDMDMFIVEDDYEKAMTCLEKELPDWIIMQSQKTDAKYSGSWTKLRDRYSQTEAWYYQGDNAFTYRGISFDLYVLHKASYNKVQVELLKENIRYYKTKYKCSGLLTFSEYFKKQLSLKSKLIIEEIKSIFEKRKDEVFWSVVPYKQKYFEKDWIFPLSKIRFEDYEFNAPNQGEVILNKIYGDYKKFPPIEKRKPGYSCVKFFREEQ